MFKKLMLVFTALILIGVVTTGLLSMEIARTYYYKGVEDKLVTSAKLIQNRLASSHDEYPKDYETLCEEFGTITGERITVIGLDGTVLGDSDAEAADMENHRDRPEVIKALDEGLGKSIRASGTLNTEMLYIAIPLDKEPGPAGVIRVALHLSDITAIQQRIWYYTLLAITLGILAALVLGYRYLSTITRPIGEMTEMASRIAGGRYNRRVKVKGTDEIGTLASTFNHMAERLEQTIEELVNDKSKIEAILSSSVNGVVAVDNNGNTMFLNPVAERMLDIRNKNFNGKPLFDLIRNEDAKKFLSEVLSAERGRSLEFELPWPRKRTIRVTSAPIRPKVKHSRTIGTLIIIHDITTVKKLQNMRSDFVANVTHELKTPLTSIKGFAETLREGAVNDPETRDRFIEIIDLEAGRLERLIEDILLLSEIESSGPSQKPGGPLDVRHVIENEILSIFTNQADQKNIVLKTRFDEGLPPLKMNKDRFKQLMINLIDNAIKFTDEGGRVEVSASSKADRAIVLKVKDNGIGIPKEHQDRLFERFYRVDKGRSRKEGGTGLGLAIVKHIALSVNGTVKVDSSPGEGTEFTVSVPLK
ncbi:MAG: cell wall metabolism sensor histidine kinase WalK [Clostridiales bacterium]|nr:cell wall metabolism sensor histidine kinase WalK [Clostridiales bacterium]